MIKNSNTRKNMLDALIMAVPVITLGIIGTLEYQKTKDYKTLEVYDSTYNRNFDYKILKKDSSTHITGRSLVTMFEILDKDNDGIVDKYTREFILSEAYISKGIFEGKDVPKDVQESYTKIMSEYDKKFK